MINPTSITDTFALPGALLASLPDPVHGLWFRSYGVSSNSAATDDFFMVIFYICLVSFIIVMGAMFMFMFAYRRRPGIPAPYSASHNTPLEITWTVVPLLILAWVFFRGFHIYADKVVPDGNALQMSLRGYKWGWELTYPNGAVSPEMETVGSQAVPILYMPENTSVRLTMHSSDVMHSFYVPDFRFKMDLFPNRYTTYSFRTSPLPIEAPALKDRATGQNVVDGRGQNVRFRDSYIFCAEYCGDLHSEMAAIIRVVPASFYEEKIQSWSGVGLTPVKLGERLYNTKGCVACHKVDGTNAAGPTWKNVFGHEVAFTDGSKYTAEQMSDLAFFSDYITRSVYEPQTQLVAGFGPAMQSYKGLVNEKEMQALIAYMISLSDQKPAGWTDAGPAEAAPANGAAPADAPAPPPATPNQASATPAK